MVHLFSCLRGADDAKNDQPVTGTLVDKLAQDYFVRCGESPKVPKYLFYLLSLVYRADTQLGRNHGMVVRPVLGLVEKNLLLFLLSP